MPLLNGAMCCLQDGSTALHVAAREGHDALIPLLLQAGADANATDKVISMSHFPSVQHCMGAYNLCVLL